MEKPKSLLNVWKEVINRPLSCARLLQLWRRKIGLLTPGDEMSIHAGTDQKHGHHREH